MNSWCPLSRKVWWAVQIGSFCPKSRYVADQNEPKGRPHENDFWIIKKWMLQTVRAEKADEKIGVIYLVSMFPSRIMVLKLSKECFFVILSRPQQET